MCVCVCTCVHVCVRVCMYGCVCARTRACACTCSYNDILCFYSKCVRIGVRICRDTNFFSNCVFHARTPVRAHTLARTHARTHIRTHTHTCSPPRPACTSDYEMTMFTHVERDIRDPRWHAREDVAAAASPASLDVDAGRPEQTVHAVVPRNGNRFHGRNTTGMLSHLTGHDICNQII